jgi:hypothetical protein
MILPAHLKGNETLRLDGLLPEGCRTLRLPGLHMLGMVTQASSRTVAGRLALDTARVDLDARQVVLVWRAAFERSDPVREVALGRWLTTGNSCTTRLGAVFSLSAP